MEICLKIFLQFQYFELSEAVSFHLHCAIDLLHHSTADIKTVPFEKKNVFMH